MCLKLPANSVACCNISNAGQRVTSCGSSDCNNRFQLNEFLLFAWQQSHHGLHDSISRLRQRCMNISFRYCDIRSRTMSDVNQQVELL